MLKEVDGDAVALNQLLQIAPWHNKDENKYTYRNQVVFFKVKDDIKVESGIVTENTAYGNGGAKQYYIPQQYYESLSKRSQIELENGGRTILLKNFEITRKEYESAIARNEQVKLRRNLFCALSAKLDTMDIIENATHVKDVKTAEMNLMKLNNIIQSYEDKLRFSIEQYGIIPSQHYDMMNKRLMAVIRCLEEHPNALILDASDDTIKKANYTVLSGGRYNYVEVEENDCGRRMSTDEILKDKLREELKKLRGIDEHGRATKALIATCTGKNFKDVEIREVMCINDINRRCMRLMRQEPLRSIDYRKVEDMFMVRSDGRVECKRLKDMFDPISVRNIQFGTNGELSGILNTSKKEKLKLIFYGRQLRWCMTKTGCLEEQIQHLHLEKRQESYLHNGGTVKINADKYVKIDKSLNRLIWADSPLRLQNNDGCGQRKNTKHSWKSIKP